MKTRSAILGFIFLFALPAWARPKTDVVVMKNGDRLTCEVKRLSRGVLYANLDYVDGTVSLDWAKIARLESNQLFVVQTAAGIVYTGTIKTPETPADEPVQLEIVEADNKEVPLEGPKVVDVRQTSESFWRRFSGNLTSGLIYSRGSNTTQYNLSSALAYRRERWEVGTNFSSALSAASGTTTTTRNQLSFGGLRLLHRSNWFYSGMGSFLQSAQQGIQLQSTVGGGFGRFLANNNQARISLTGGIALQGTNYEGTSSSETPAKVIAGWAGANVQLFKFKKTNLDLTAAMLPALSQPGRVWFNTNATYSIQIITNLWWTFTFYGNWDNRPPPGLSGSDYGSSSGITYSFN